LLSLFRPQKIRTRRPEPLNEQEARILSEFSRHFGLTFHHPDLLKLALTHRSYLSVSGQGPRESNERLEFLGDSVLGLVTSEFLYREHPTEHEGQLTKTKSLLVSKAILSRRALAMGLGRFVLMSHSEVESGGRQRLSILADAFEAVLGAVYLDQGFEAAREFIAHWLLRDSRAIAADKRHTNFKSHLQEYVQSTFRTHPVYRIRSEMGPDHSKLFHVEVMVGRRVLGSGKGRNKKEAEQSAARNALEQVENVNLERDRRERPAPEPAPTAVVEALPPTAEPAGEEEGLRRRRRGRRGGKGRRTRADGMPAERGPMMERTAEAPGPARPAATSTPPAREKRVDAPEPLERIRESYEYDEYEEVGRPEGPLEERHVDPYESTSELEDSGPEVESEEIEPEVESPDPAEHATEERGSSAREEWTEGEGEDPGPEPRSGSSPAFGRRGGRSRR
jgi:ribonuclease-3